MLNSLSEDKLQASVTCLARLGRILEISKYYLTNDSALNLLFMEQEVSYQGIISDDVLEGVPEIRSKVIKCLQEGVKVGFVKLLPRICLIQLR